MEVSVHTVLCFEHKQQYSLETQVGVMDKGNNTFKYSVLYILFGLCFCKSQIKIWNVNQN